MKRFLCILKDRSRLLDLTEGRDDWEFRIVADRRQAFEALRVEQFEAVVTDGGCNEFLKEVSVRYPKLARLLLFDPTGKNRHPGGQGVVDDWVPAPCTPEALVDTARRTRLLRMWLSEPALARLFSRMRKIPSVPVLYSRLVSMLQTPDCHLEEVGTLMSEDPAMTARLLQMVNSTFFALKRTINSTAEAVAHLGIQQVKALVLLAQVFSICPEEIGGFSLCKLWRHSLYTARYARAIAENVVGSGPLADAAFSAGLLHDVGKLLHAVNFPDEYEKLVAQAQRKNVSYIEAERDLFGTTHAELCASLLCTWGLPVDILEAVAFHHVPARHDGTTFEPVTAVYVANMFEHQLSPSPAPGRMPATNHLYLEHIGCGKHVAEWKALCAKPWAA